MTIVLAAVVNEVYLDSGPARNVVQWAALAYALALATPVVQGIGVQGLTRRKPAGIPLVPLVLGVFAFAIGVQSFSIPYLCDDHATVARARGAPSLLDWLEPGQPAAGYFFRPAVWWQWWIVERITPNSPVAARCLSLGWFVLASLLVAPALRRCGVRRDVAILTAFLYTANPTAVSTIAWLSNLYSQSSLTLALAAIASMPFRRPRPLGMGLTACLAFLSYLSKEDTILLPIAAFAIGARFRIRQARRGLLHATPFVIALLTAVALRYTFLGSFGGYEKDGVHGVTSLSRWWVGVTWGLTHEFPWMFWVPVRESVLQRVPDAGRVLLAVAPSVVLLTSSRVAGIRGLVARSSLFIVLPLIPVGSILGMTLTLLNVRLAFMSSIGFMLLWSAGILGCLPRRWLAGSLFAMSLLTFLWIGRANLESHVRAGETSERILDIAARASAALPESARVALGPMPEESDGVYALEAGFGFAVARRSGQRNLIHRPRAGLFDDFFEFDLARQTLRRPSEVKPAFVLAYGQPHGYSCAAADVPDVVNGSVSPGRSYNWCVFSTSDGTVVYLPTVELPGPGALKFTLDGGIVGAPHPRRLEVLATFLLDTRRVLRAIPEDSGFLVPPEARAARMELLVPLGHAVEYSGFHLEIDRTPLTR